MTLRRFASAGACLRTSALSLLLLAAALALGPHPARAGADPRAYCVQGIYVGMSEADLQRAMGSLIRAESSDVPEIDGDKRFELWSPRRDRDVVVAIDKTRRVVCAVVGTELYRDGQQLVRAGEFQFRVQLGLMPWQHDEKWVYHADRFKLAFLFTVETAKTNAVLSRIIAADAAVEVKGGWLGGVDPRPNRSGTGTEFR